MLTAAGEAGESGEILTHTFICSSSPTTFTRVKKLGAETRRDPKSLLIRMRISRTPDQICGGLWGPWEADQGPDEDTCVSV